MKAFNFATVTPYSGAAAGLEGNGPFPGFATFKQIQSLGYKVNKGAKAVKIFCGYHITTKAKQATDDDGTKFNSPRYALVFDIADTNALEDTEFVTYLTTELKQKGIA